MFIPDYNHDLAISYNISQETDWKFMYICVVDSSKTIRADMFLPKTDVDSTTRYHYCGGYLANGNFFGASVGVSDRAIGLARCVKNGTDVTDAYLVVRMYK